MINYRFKVLKFRVLDGDTVECEVDMGFNCKYCSVFRLLYSAPELDSKDPEERRVAKEIATELTMILNSDPKNIEVETIKKKRQTDKYGRYLANLFVGELPVEEFIREKFKDWIK